MKIYELEFNKKGKRAKKLIKAYSINEAQSKALRQGLQIISLAELKSKKSFKISNEDFIFFFKNLSLLSEVGLSVQASLKELEKALNQKNLLQALKALREDLNSGQSLSKALENSSFNLSFSELALVKIAENTGELAKVFARIANLRHNLVQNKKLFIKALRYPLIVFFALSFAFVFLMLFVVPNFQTLFETMGADLPFVTILMLEIYEFLDRYFLLLFFVLIIAFVFCVFAYKKFYNFTLFCDFLLLHIPVLGTLMLCNQNYYFFIIFSLLLKSGVPINKAFELASLGINNRALALKFIQIFNSLSQGMELTLAFSKANIFDNLVLSMLSIAMKSANLEFLSEQIASFYENKQKELMDKFLVFIEPLMTLVVAIMVLFLALGIFLPIWELSNQNF